MKRSRKEKQEARVRNTTTISVNSLAERKLQKQLQSPDNECIDLSSISELIDNLYLKTQTIQIMLPIILHELKSLSAQSVSGRATRRRLTKK